jgi:BirA family biotin operon repressor/biotin-[acetyl-CoA-carboxylase] ligase
LTPIINTIGNPFVELQQVDSTNNYATAMAHAGMAQHGTAVLAQHQTKGKGQRTKAWETLPGQNITMSIILQPQPLVLSEAFLLSMAVAVGVQRFFVHYAGDEVSVKWPNDLYWRDRKAGGILIENILTGADWKYAVVGMGININQTDFGELGLKATSLKQITGKAYDVMTLSKELCQFLGQAYQELLTNKQNIVEAYHAVLYKRSQKVKLRKDTRVFETLIKGVSLDGQLITEHGMEERFSVGEVEWIAPSTPPAPKGEGNATTPAQ